MGSPTRHFSAHTKVLLLITALGTTASAIDIDFLIAIRRQACRLAQRT